jgi:hypothetical protein
VADYSIPDLTAWEAFCPSCKTYGSARRAQEGDVLSREEYFEFVCMECHTVLLTFQRAKVTERFNEQTTPDGHELIYDVRKGGDVVGELCATQHQRPDRVVALERTEAIPVPYGEVMEVFQKQPDRLAQLVEVFCHALVEAYEQMNSLAIDDTVHTASDLSCLRSGGDRRAGQGSMAPLLAKAVGGSRRMRPEECYLVDLEASFIVT